MAKTVKRIVTHPKLRMSNGGKLQHIPAGTEISLTEEQLKGRLGKMTRDPGDVKSLEMGEKGLQEKAASDHEAELAELKARAEKAEKDAAAAVARAEKAEKALIASTTKNATSK